MVPTHYHAHQDPPSPQDLLGLSTPRPLTGQQTWKVKSGPQQNQEGYYSYPGQSFNRQVLVTRQYASLLFALSQDDTSPWDSSELSEYKRYRQDMTLVDGIALYKGRIVVPKVLRQEVLGALHCAHQGATGMSLRAQDAV